jgi:glycerophosphoryl diester phosphodiesterase
MENIFRRGAALPRPVLNIAHRGASSLAPENTLTAAHRAFELSADLWEFDVRITKDGVPILMHDMTLRRTTDVYRRFPTRAPWWVHLFALDEIKQLDAGPWFNDVDPFGQIRAGVVSREERRAYCGEPIPTLEEALRFTKERSWRANIEVKQTDYLGPQLIARKVVEVVQGLEMQDYVLISSYDQRILREVESLDARIAVAIIVALRPSDPVQYLKELQVDAYHSGPLAFNLQDLERLRQMGFAVNVWTYDAPERLAELAAAGVSGIFTNFPQRLEPILDRLFGSHEESAEPEPGSEPS